MNVSILFVMKSEHHSARVLQIAIVVIVVLVGSYAIWAKENGSLTPWHLDLNTDGCPGDKISISPRDGGKIQCVEPLGGSDDVNCSTVPNGAFYKTPDGATGDCFNDQQMPILGP